MSTSGGAAGGALKFASGALASTVQPGDTYTAVLTTSSLATGTWLIDYTLQLGSGGTASNLTFEVVAGTATATFAPVANAAVTMAANNTTFYSAHLTTLATITAAGTVVLNGQNSVASGGGVVTELGGIAGGTCTGWTAIKVA